MIKFYNRLLLVFLAFIVLLNVVTAVVSLNPRQIINFAFYDTRTLALIYFAKNIILESGISPKSITIDEQLKLVDSASKDYSIDPKLLKLLIAPEEQFSISLTGGMGLTRINPYSFFETPFIDPYNAKENIYATASIIKQLSIDKEIFKSEIPRAFLTQNLNYETLRKFSPQTNQLIYTLTKRYNEHLDSINEDKTIINIFSNGY